MSKEKLTQEYLKECLDYDPESGIFKWKERPVSHFKDGKRFKVQTICNNWNSRYFNEEVGSLYKNKYKLIAINNKKYLTHRLAWLYMEGYFPENMIDYIDMNKSNNKWSNLREVSKICNTQNCRVSKNNTSGVTGVHQEKGSQRWCSQIQIKGKHKILGCYKNFNDAVFA